MRDGDSLRVVEDGAQRFRAAFGGDDLRQGLDAFAGLRADQAGIRVHGSAAATHLLRPGGAIARVAESVLSTRCRAVRAILFDKTAAMNWALGWHQDRTIVVKARADVPGFGPWTVKQGLLHVEPPPTLLADMLTLRLHLDAVPASNAPLLVAPGSHRFGRIPEPEIPDVVRRCGTVACLAEVGDIWLYATPILHASEAAAAPDRRRVIQVDFAAADLPGGLAWLGV
jgi:hypothetical protein